MSDEQDQVELSTLAQKLATLKGPEVSKEEVQKLLIAHAYDVATIPREAKVKNPKHHTNERAALVELLKSTEEGTDLGALFDTFFKSRRDG